MRHHKHSTNRCCLRTSSVNESKTYQPIPFNIHTVEWFESRKLFEYYKKDHVSATVRTRLLSNG